MIKERLEKILCEIDEVTKNVYSDEEHVGALVGLSGISLFQFYYSKYRNTNDHSAIGVEILQRVTEKINQGYNYPTFCNGIGGAGWVLNHLDENGFIDIDCDELLSTFDDLLYSMMVSDMRRKNYDFLHGGIGYALYFIGRYRNAKSEPLQKKYRGYLLGFIALLKANSEHDGNGLKWISIQTRGELHNTYNLGLSHGMAGIIAILAKLHAFDDFKGSTENMLKGAISYVMGYRKENDSFFLFPNLVSTNGGENGPSRLGWCYGDLGIGLQLWFASKELDDQALAHKAILILKHCANRRLPEETLVKDAALCHGSYGIALMFLRIYKETLDPDFSEAVEFWIQDGLQKAFHKDGYAGYKQWRDVDSWRNEISLLEGITGIGLAIMDYLTGSDNKWDECLLIS